ncbi:MFS transporter [Acetobacteraceae bacterium H6797]|nr:MFS transporter [Acetobacteraceae bacterium H6797]
MSGATTPAAPAAAASPPGVPNLTLWRSLACILASGLLWTTQGLGLNLTAANTYQLQGTLGVSLNEANWLIAAYMAPNVSLTIVLTKIRTQFGLRRFAEISLILFAIASVLNIFVNGLHSAVAVRFLSGIAASPISTLGFLYMLDAFPQAKKLTWGLSLALTFTAVTPFLARVISPPLLDIGQWTQLYKMELGLALMSLATVFLLPLAPVPHAKVIEKLDFITYPLIAIGFGALAIVMSLGRLYWWLEAPWLGVLLAVFCVTIAIAAAIEIRRENPLMNVRWLFSPEILHLAFVLLGFRILLAEQTSGIVGYFTQIGLLNEQSHDLYLVAIGVSVLGGLLCGATMTPARVPLFHAVALLCIAIGSFLDGQMTNLTRPDDMMLGQGLIAFGGAIFLPTAMLRGLLATLKQGTQFLTSFILVFLFTQSLGGLMGSALFSTVVVLREKLHSSYIVEHLKMTDPIVADRVHQLAGSYGHVLTDQTTLNAEGAALLGQIATREAYVLAYNDAFQLCGLLALISLFFLILHTVWDKLRAMSAARRSAEAS